jgi:hypothetical protein
MLMGNHYHLIVETPTPTLSRGMRHLNGVYTQAFNRRHQRVGHLFQGRFKAILGAWGGGLVWAVGCGSGGAAGQGCGSGVRSVVWGTAPRPEPFQIAMAE